MARITSHIHGVRITFIFYPVSGSFFLYTWCNVKLCELLVEITCIRHTETGDKNTRPVQKKKAVGLYVRWNVGTLLRSWTSFGYCRWDHYKSKWCIWTYQYTYRCFSKLLHSPTLDRCRFIFSCYEWLFFLMPVNLVCYWPMACSSTAKGKYFTIQVLKLCLRHTLILATCCLSDTYCVFLVIMCFRSEHAR